MELSEKELTENTITEALNYFRDIKDKSIKIPENHIMVSPKLYKKLEKEAKINNVSIEAIYWKHMFQNHFNTTIGDKNGTNKRKS